MKMKTEQIIGIAGVLGIAYYVFFCKKKPTGATEETTGGGGGGGIGGGGFAPPTGLAVLQTPTVTTTPATPRPASQGRSYTAAEVTKSKDTTPTAAVTSSAQAKAIETATNTGGIVPIGQGGSSTPTYSTGTVTQSQMSTGLQGGLAFKPFSGKGVLTLDNLLM
jgi:hypothetical protein